MQDLHAGLKNIGHAFRMGDFNLGNIIPKD